MLPKGMNDIGSIIFIDTEISLKNVSIRRVFFRSLNQVFLILKGDLRIGNHFRKKNSVCPPAGFTDQPKDTKPDHAWFHLNLSGVISVSDQTAWLSAATLKFVQWNGIYHIIIIGLVQKITRRDLYCNHPFHPLSHSAKLLQANLKLLCQSSKGIFTQVFQSLKSSHLLQT